MKKILQLIAYPAFAMLCVTVQAQTKIEVNFKDIKPKYEQTIKNKETFTVHISNINRNLYKVDGVKTETDYNSAVPTALTGIKLPGYLYTQQPSDDKMKSPGGESISSATVYNQIKELLNEVVTRAKKLDDATVLYNDLSHLQKNCSDDGMAVTTSVMERTSQYLTGSKTYGTKTSIQMISDLEEFLYDQRNKAATALDSAAVLIQQYEVTALTELSAAQADAKMELNKVKVSVQKGGLTTEKKLTASRMIAKYQQQIDDFLKDKATLETIIDQLKQNLVKAQGTVEDMRKFEKDDKIYAITRLMKLLVNSTNFEYTSETITAKTDEIKYVITIEPTELNTCDVNGKRIIEVTVKVNNGLKIDFSTGVFLNGGSDDFLGRSYYYQNIDADNRQIVAADRGTRYLLSVGALMHFYKRSTSNLKLGGSVGVSTTAAVTDLLFHVGPSIFLGNKNRVVISGGLTLKSSSLLDQKLQMNTTYTKLQSPDAIPTVSVFPTAGYFFSLTYNFTKLSSK